MLSLSFYKLKFCSLTDGACPNGLPQKDRFWKKVRNVLINGGVWWVSSWKGSNYSLYETVDPFEWKAASSHSEFFFNVNYCFVSNCIDSKQLHALNSRMGIKIAFCDKTFPIVGEIYATLLLKRLAFVCFKRNWVEYWLWTLD